MILISLSACSNSSYDPGGSVLLYTNKMLAARQANAKIEIEGTCLSSCVLKLGSGKGVCINPNAILGVHEVRNTIDGNYSSGIRDELETLKFSMMLPICVTQLFHKHPAFSSPQYTYFKGQDILDNCPEFHSCN